MSKDIRTKNYLFRLRRMRRMSQKRFAALLGLRSPKAIGKYEHGARLPPLIIAMQMEIVLGTKLSEIYVDLYRELGLAAVDREDRLPGAFFHHIRGRVLGKDHMSVLDAVEASLKDFRPKTHRQFVVFHIARRFDDLPNLARYLNVCDQHPKKVLLEAARLAQKNEMEQGGSTPEHFFELLASWQKERAA
jgi:transcriptional regulator with XRE-family HTH domain